MRRVAAAGWLCKASRGPRSGMGAGDQFAFRVFHLRRVALGAMSVNQALHDVMRGEQIEAIIRQAIREELHAG